MLDIFFLNGPFLPGFSRESRSPAVTKSGTLYYPAWLAYACGYSEQQGLNCKLYDSVARKTSHEDTYDLILKDDPSFLVIGTSTPSISNDIEIARYIKSVKPSIVTILVGTHASSTAREIIENNSCVDFVARREYDITIFSIYTALRDNLDLADVPGITTKYKREALLETPDRPYIHDLDVIPFASKIYSKHLNIEDYYYGHVKYPMVSIFTSRGCNAKCTYCVYPQTMFGMHRARSPKNIADEFEWIKNNLPQVKEILVDDDTFTMNPGHAREVSRELISRKNKLQWTCEVRSTLDKETLSLMKSAGCRLVVVGFESMDSNVLRNIKKGTVPSQTNNFVDACNQVGIKIHACFMAGNPGDSLATLNSTLDWALSKNFDTAQFFPVQLYPGTQAYLDAASAGQLKPKSYREWISEDGLHSMTLSNNDTGLSSKDIEAFCDLARRKFYLRKRYIFKKSLQLFYDPVEFYKNVKGFLNIRKYLFADANR